MTYMDLCGYGLGHMDMGCHDLYGYGLGHMTYMIVNVYGLDHYLYININ